MKKTFNTTINSALDLMQQVTEHETVQYTFIATWKFQSMDASKEGKGGRGRNIIGCNR